MKKKIINCAILGLLLCTMASCSSQKSLYSWYNYEDATYQYSKKNTPELYQKMME